MEQHELTAILLEALNVYLTPAADDEQKQEELGDKMPLKKEVPRIRVQKTGSSPEKSENRSLFSGSLGLTHHLHYVSESL
ncbi:MAG: hypothetical protein K2P74_02340 [Nitrosomonas sp.]|nr:hypothetical protein [Nitrosomonas sp.]